jgi:RHS repeat-associated protein
VKETDLSPTFFGLPWGHRREYTNRLERDFNFGMGWNWLVVEWPFLEEYEDGSILIVQGARKQLRFDPKGGGFVPRFGGPDELIREGNALIFAAPDGTTSRFALDQGSRPRGRITAYTRAGGDTVHFYYEQGGLVATARSFDDSIGQPAKLRLAYRWLPSVGGTACLSEVTLSRETSDRSSVEVARARYTYYGSRSPHGAEGDLAEVECATRARGEWEVVRRSYYRYYTGAESRRGFPHGLKLLLDTEGIRQLSAARNAPLDSIPESVLNEFAAFRFEYDPRTRYAISSTLGGSRHCTFAYAGRAYAAMPGTNEWYTKTTETQPDGTIATVYSNIRGQVLLIRRQYGGIEQFDYHRYDDEGRRILRADTAAVEGYDETRSDLEVKLHPDEGVVRTFVSHYMRGEGSTVERVQYESLRLGEHGTEHRISELHYELRRARHSVLPVIVKSVIYTGENSTGPVVTTVSYEWYPDTVQIMQRTIYLPDVTLENNGPSTGVYTMESYDSRGLLVAYRDEAGIMKCIGHDPYTWQQIRMVEDSSTGLPPSWTPLPGAHFNRTTDLTVDVTGAYVAVIAPPHLVDGRPVRRVDWFREFHRKLLRYSIRTTGYLDGGEARLTEPPAPVDIVVSDGAARIHSIIRSERGPVNATAEPVVSDDYDDRSRWTRWEQRLYSHNGWLSATRVYHRIPLSGAGRPGEHYSETRLLSDVMGRQVGYRAPGGTITRSTRDASGHIIEISMGTDDSGFATENFCESDKNNLRPVARYQYARNGAMIAIEQLIDDDAATLRTTRLTYDFRGRLTSQSRPVENTVCEFTWDNADRVRLVRMLAGGRLMSHLENRYDERGRLIREIQHGTGPNEGAAMVGSYWYGLGAQIVEARASGSGILIRYQRDALGRITSQSLGYSPAEHPQPGEERIIQELERQYELAGEVVAEVFSGYAGNGPRSTESSEHAAHRTCTWYWRDGIGREVARAVCGANQAEIPRRPACPPPASDAVLVTELGYDAGGQQCSAIDPMGVHTRWILDAAGRVTSITRNYVASLPQSAGGPDVNRLVEYDYTSAGAVARMTVRNAATGDQVTKYEYGTNLATSLVARADLLSRVVYPDSQSATDSVSMRYNRQGEVRWMKDQNGTEHEYVYNSHGKCIVDRVLMLGAGVDEGTRRIDFGYGPLSELESVTTYDASHGGKVVNQLRREYDGFGNMVREWQEHSGRVSRESPSTGYQFSATGDRMRLEAVFYPSGRSLRYDYGREGEADDRLGRMKRIHFEGGHTFSTEYSYNGLRAVRSATYSPPGLRSDFGRDAFGRVDRLHWQRSQSDGGGIVSLRYEYDRCNNQVLRKDELAKRESYGRFLDELCTYDGLYRLVEFERGEAVGRSITRRNLRQSWRVSVAPFSTGLDACGNWTEYARDGVAQERTHNQANEITTMREPSKTALSAPGYDDAGNMRLYSLPVDAGSQLRCIYDAWNRVVAISTDEGQPILRCEYDGANRRVVKRFVDHENNGLSRHYYYDSNQRVIEERLAHDNAEPRTDRRFLWSPWLPSDLILREHIREDGSEERVYSVPDRNHNTVALLSEDGHVIRRFAYEAYGAPVVLTPEFTPEPGALPDWEILFGGYYWDRESGLYLAGRRFLHPRLGRWISRDPVGYTGGINLYEYCRGNPASLVDPEGTVEHDDINPEDVRDYWYAGLCWPTANDIIAMSVLVYQPHSRSYLNRTVTSIVHCESACQCWTKNPFRPDIVLFNGPRPCGVGQLWEMKKFDALIWLAIAQIASYLNSFSGCCINVGLGNCGAGTFGLWHNTRNPGTCGEFLGWVCIDGLIIYAWSATRLEIAATLIVLAVLFPQAFGSLAAAASSLGAGLQGVLDKIPQFIPGQIPVPGFGY